MAAGAAIAIVVAIGSSGDDGGAKGPGSAAASGAGIDGGIVGIDGGTARDDTTGAGPRDPGPAGAGAGSTAAGGTTPTDPAGGVPPLSTTLAPGGAEVRVGRIEHPVIAAVVASTDGVVERIHVKAGGSVTTGQKLYSLRAGKGVGVRSSEVIATSPAAGRIERRAARGDRVAKGDVLAQLVDPERWLVIADLRSDDVTTAWSCAIATAEGRNRAPCRVETVQRLGPEQSRATVTVATDQATWLQGGEQALLLRLIPPGGAAESTTPTGVPPAPAGSGTSTAGSDRDEKDTAGSGQRGGRPPGSQMTGRSGDGRGPDAGR